MEPITTTFIALGASALAGGLGRRAKKRKTTPTSNDTFDFPGAMV